MTAVLITPPALEPLTLAEAKAHLRLDTTDEDDLVTSLIVSARHAVERETRRALITQSWRVILDAWPDPNTFRIPLAPFISLSAIRTFDVFNAAAVLGASAYFVDAQPAAARVQFTLQPPNPGRAIAGIELDVVIGYGAAAASVPEPLRLAMRMLVARWFEARGDAAGDAGALQIPPVAAALLQPFRTLRLA